MYDTVLIDHGRLGALPGLPDGVWGSELRPQTKDLEKMLETYMVSEDGLYKRVATAHTDEYNEFLEVEMPQPSAWEWEYIEYHGDIEFHSAGSAHDELPDDEWYSWRARLDEYDGLRRIDLATKKGEFR